ncbi:predicted GPI-anchored protein 58 [Portunus trituberculatus]|uniref:predicted GPI-anchored protein 58 n=1 Tax=Portunus trituberculatus TaxID=210409 RepID=UPI001E1CDD38|nr:predicted GPI-anchored protein 58 [Portunus trituberculatus]
MITITLLLRRYRCHPPTHPPTGHPPAATSPPGVPETQQHCLAAGRPPGHRATGHRAPTRPAQARPRQARGVWSPPSPVSFSSPEVPRRPGCPQRQGGALTPPEAPRPLLLSRPAPSRPVPPQQLEPCRCSPCASLVCSAAPAPPAAARFYRAHSATPAAAPARPAPPRPWGGAGVGRRPGTAGLSSLPTAAHSHELVRAGTPVVRPRPRPLCQPCHLKHILAGQCAGTGQQCF